MQTTLALTIGGSSLFGASVAVLAQDGSGGATPEPITSTETAATCAIPDLSAARPQVEPPTAATPEPTATTAPTEAVTKVASPVGGTPVASPVNGTPEASPVVTKDAATPVATTAPTEAAANDPIATGELTASAKAIADCLTKGDYTTLASLTGDDFRGQLIGADGAVSAEDFADVAPSIAVIPYTIVSVTDATIDGDAASALVTYRIGNQIRAGEWTFAKGEVDGQAVWTLEQETPKAVAASDAAVTSSVTIEKNAYAIDPSEINGSEVHFTITNKDSVDHELFVVKLDKNVKVDVLLTTPGPGLPDGVTFVGQVTVPAGSNSELLLAELEPGTYQVVDLLPNAQGLPNLSDGMEATFTVK